MSIRRPVPQHPREGIVSSNWDKWFNLVSGNSVKIVDFDITINPSSVAANTTAEQDFTVTGLGVNDIPLTVIKPTLTAGIGIGNIRVKAINTLSITFINPTGSPIDPPSETYKLIIIRQ